MNAVPIVVKAAPKALFLLFLIWWDIETGACNETNLMRHLSSVYSVTIIIIIIIGSTAPGRPWPS
jgi:hypothetical protein